MYACPFRAGATGLPAKAWRTIADDSWLFEVVSFAAVATLVATGIGLKRFDPEGRIAKHYAKVNPETHSQEVLADLKSLMEAS